MFSRVCALTIELLSCAQRPFSSSLSFAKNFYPFTFPALAKGDSLFFCGGLALFANFEGHLRATLDEQNLPYF